MAGTVSDERWNETANELIYNPFVGTRLTSLKSVNKNLKLPIRSINDRFKAAPNVFALASI